MGNSKKAMRKVSIIIPVIRPENVERLKRIIPENAGISSSRFVIDIREDRHRIGCPKMTRNMVVESAYDLICFMWNSPFS